MPWVSAHWGSTERRLAPLTPATLDGIGRVGPDIPVVSDGQQRRHDGPKALPRGACQREAMSSSGGKAGLGAPGREVTMDDATTAVTLVLGSGGARGLAHIGVIRALEADGRFSVRAVTGTSIGALVGGLYAAGTLDEYARWVSGLSRRDVWGLLDFSFTRQGLFEGERLMTLLAKLLGDVRIEDLPIPFTAVASDLHRRQEVWLARGSLFEAIRASIAVPGLFTPVERNGRLLVDGGLLSPLPVAPMLQHEAPCMIAVSLNGPAPPAVVDAAVSPPVASPGPAGTGGAGSVLLPVRRWLGRAVRKLGLPVDAQRSGNGLHDEDAFDTLAQSVEAMQDRISRYQLAACRPDLLIEIPVDSCGVLEFHRADEMISLGERVAREALQGLRLERVAGR
jgi:NTE family protein